MRHRSIRFALAGMVLVLAAAGAASAQGSVSANYDVIYHEFEETTAVGAHFDAAKAFGNVAVLGELGFNRFESATVVSFAGGGRYLITDGAIRPAAQFLFGNWHCGACDFDELFIQPGFLVDIPRAAFAIRVQFDFRRILFDFGGENAERLSVGLVWGF